MHDIDRAMFEVAQEGLGEYESYEAYETQTEAEAYEAQLASELLGVTSEAELEQFLGNLVGRAARAVRGFANSPTGRSLVGILKGAAKKALPQAGRVIGNAISPGLGPTGAKLGQWLGNQFEAEGLSDEDREFEVARAFVRLGTAATRNALASGPYVPPGPAATQAVVSAAQRHLPGLVPTLRPGAGPAVSGTVGELPTTGGRWIRRGNRIILLDL